MAEDRIIVDIESQIDMEIAKFQMYLSQSQQAFGTRNIVQGAKRTQRATEQLQFRLIPVTDEMEKMRYQLAQLGLHDLPGLNREMRVILGSTVGMQIPTVEPVARSTAVITPSPGYRMKHFYRPDIKDHFVLDDLADKLRDQHRYPLETLKVVAIGQTGSIYAGQSLDVLAPVFGIGAAPATYEVFRIFRLHHSVVKNSAESQIPGYTFLTEYELVRQVASVTPQLVHPTRIEYDLTPTEAMLREFRLEQKYRIRENFRRHI